MSIDVDGGELAVGHVEGRRFEPSRASATLDFQVVPFLGREASPDGLQLVEHGVFGLRPELGIPEVAQQAQPVEFLLQPMVRLDPLRAERATCGRPSGALRMVR